MISVGGAPVTQVMKMMELHNDYWSETMPQGTRSHGVEVKIIAGLPLRRAEREVQNIPRNPDAGSAIAD